MPDGFRANQRGGAWVLVLGLGTILVARQPNDKSKDKNADDQALVERLLAARREYQVTLETLRGPLHRGRRHRAARWAEEELIQFHRITKQAFRLDLDVPPPKLQGPEQHPRGQQAVPHGDRLQGQGLGHRLHRQPAPGRVAVPEAADRTPAERQDQRRRLPARRHLREQGVQAVRSGRRPTTSAASSGTRRRSHDARMRGARLYEHQLNKRGRAMEIYQEIITHETIRSTSRRRSGGWRTWAA